MAQNRDAPAFQEYASALLAKAEFRFMTAESKGVCWQIRLECWVNKRVPANPALLARYLGEDPALIERVLPQIMPFFERDGDFIHSPELDDYRVHLDGIRDKQSAGGKKSAEKKASAAKGAKPRASKGFQGDSSNLKDTCNSPSSDLQVLSTVQTSPNQSNPAQPIWGNVPNDDVDEWLGDYERASKGW